MSGISRTLGGLKSASTEANTVNGIIETTSTLADKVGTKVRRLDEARVSWHFLLIPVLSPSFHCENHMLKIIALHFFASRYTTKKRVSECQQRVHDLIDLQVCSQGVMAAIKSEDYEKGAIHINRFLSMDEKLLKRTADDVSGSITSVSQALITLNDATARLRHIIGQKFDEAVARDDLASVERFFKIFPLLGMHSQGIDKFAHYINIKLEKKSQKDIRTSLDIAKAENRIAVAYADLLTLVFENFARVIEVNQPIIESYYGLGHLIQFFQHLQPECDVEVKRVLTEFHKNRQVQNRMQKINDYQKTTGQQNLGHFRKPSGGSIDKLDAKEIDGLLNEITMMHARAELYIKFMKRKIAVSDWLHCLLSAVRLMWLMLL